MTELTHEDIMRAMEAKSDQLNAVDLIAGPITVKIVAARKGDKKQPIVLDIEGYKGKPWKPCKTMFRIMAEVWRRDTDTKMLPGRWIGQSVTLYRDPEVYYGGDQVGGVRISHLSGLDKPRTFLVTETRGKTVKRVIHPIPTLSPENQKYIEASAATLKAAESLEELQGHGEMLKTKSKPIQDALRPIYKARKAELEPAVEDAPARPSE